MNFTPVNFRICLFYLSLTAGLLVGGAGSALFAGSASADSVAQLNDQALAAHRRRCLNEASAFYTRVLKLDPPAEPTPEQKELVRKFAPRLYNVAGEFFPLKDIVAILHPDKPVIAYHLFWEDDWGYPSDNDPCDHEIVWVEYAPATGRVTKVSTFFHGAILSPAAAIEDANAHGGRPWIGVEWGFHGSLPFGTLPKAKLTLWCHWFYAHILAPHRPRDPLARGWPTSFPGDYGAYVNFNVPNEEAIARLQKDDLVFVSRWPMATINRYCLRYNFGVKLEWPWLGQAKN